MLTDTKLKKSLGRRREKVEVISDAQGLNVRLSAAGAVTFSIDTGGKASRYS